MAPAYEEGRERGPRLERAIVLQLLRGDHRSRWSRGELALELDAEMLALEEALIRLEGSGVLCQDAGAVWASRSARTLDQLGLLAL